MAAVDKTLIAGLFALIGAVVGAGATMRNRRLDVEARSRAALEAAVVDYVTALEELLISLDVLGFRDLPGEAQVDRFLATLPGHLISAPFRLATYLVFPMLSTTRQASRLRRAGRRLDLVADEVLLREVKRVEELLGADRKDAEWAARVADAAKHVTVAARRAISPPRSRLPWRGTSSAKVERLLLSSASAPTSQRR